MAVVDEFAGAASRTTPEEIPILDIGPYLAGAPGARERLAGEIDRACSQIGFFFIVNHGFDAEVVARSFDAARAFFALPATTKAKLRMNRHQSGWQAPNASVYGDSFEDTVLPQVSEAFKFTFELADDDPDVIAGKRYRGHNQWPTAVPDDFKPTLLAYLDAFHQLGLKLLAPLAVALELEPDWFDPYFARASSQVRCCYYPILPFEAGQHGLSSHTDLSFLSMLPPASAPGLQIQTQSGAWIDQPVVADAILVNTGNTLRCWTNDRFIATPHRVLAATTEERYSNVFFFLPSVDTMIECMPSCTDPANPPKYDPISFSDVHSAFAAANFAYAEEVE